MLCSGVDDLSALFAHDLDDVFDVLRLPDDLPHGIGYELFEKIDLYPGAVAIARTALLPADVIVVPARSLQ